jgi:hypothetical protein
MLPEALPPMLDRKSPAMIRFRTFASADRLEESLMRLHIGAVILILLGVIFLLINLDIAPAAELKKMLTTWWPLLLIVVGVLAIMRPRRAS